MAQSELLPHDKCVINKARLECVERTRRQRQRCLFPGSAPLRSLPTSARLEVGPDYPSSTGQIGQVLSGNVEKSARQRPEDLVEKHWQQIAAVAAALLKDGVFTGDIRTLFPQPRRSI